MYFRKRKTCMNILILNLVTYHELIQVNFSLYSYNSAQNGGHQLSEIFINMVNCTCVTLITELSAHAFSISSLRLGRVVNFLRYTTSSRETHLGVTLLAEKASHYFFFSWSVYTPFGRLCIDTYIFILDVSDIEIRIYTNKIEKIDRN